MKITKKVTTVENVEIEVNLPLYFKSNAGAYYYKIDADESLLTISETFSRISRNKKGEMFYESELSEAMSRISCSEEEFEGVFNRTLELFQQLQPAVL